jgi:hypothetical protein
MIRITSLLPSAALAAVLALAAPGAIAQPPRDAKGFQVSQWQMEQMRRPTGAATARPPAALAAAPVRLGAAEVTMTVRLPGRDASTAVAARAPGGSEESNAPGGSEESGWQFPTDQATAGARSPAPARIVLRPAESVTIRIVPR